ncbi:MAG: hypothetical protein HKL84_08195 [Acidimicrobiaceae bacterium]|nr:hypothetical protein [Acidimicrobiaceae bacterium]
MPTSDTHQPEGHPQGHHHEEITIIVNGEQKIESRSELTFVEVLDLAFPPPRPAPEKDYSITFKGAASIPHDGSLNLRAKVEIRGGTRFDVTPTIKS